MWRKSTAIKYTALIAALSFILGGAAGAIGVLGNGLVRTRLERKFLVELKDYKYRATECERKLNVMYDVWSGTASIDKLTNRK